MHMSQISFVDMGNSIYMLSFPNSHIVFLQKIYVALIGLEVCFFAKRVRVLVKGTRRQIMVIRFLCHPETIESDGMQRQIMVICFLCHPETIKSDGIWRQIMVIRFLCHPKTIKSDGMRRQIMVIRFLFHP